jgi:hypothetical protein
MQTELVASNWVHRQDLLFRDTWMRYDAISFCLCLSWFNR